MKTVAWITLFATMANLAILIAVGSKLQVAKEDAAKAFSNFSKNPLNSLLSLVRTSREPAPTN